MANGHGGSRERAGFQKLTEARWFFVVEAYRSILVRLHEQAMFDAEAKCAVLQQSRRIKNLQPKPELNEPLEDFAARRRAWCETVEASQNATDLREDLKNYLLIPATEPPPFCASDENETPSIGEFGVVVCRPKQLKGWHPRIQKILQYWIRARWNVSVSTHSIEAHWNNRED